MCLVWRVGPYCACIWVAMPSYHCLCMCELYPRVLQPANLFYRNGKYKIGDLGLARYLSTVTRQVEEGDARYLALELLSDDVSHLPQSDIFSLGARYGNNTIHALLKFALLCCMHACPRGFLCLSDVSVYCYSLYELGRGCRLPGSGEEWTSLRHGIIPPIPTLSPRFNTILARMMQVHTSINVPVTYTHVCVDGVCVLQRDPSKRPSAEVLLRDHIFPSPPTPAEHYYRTLAALYRERWLSLGRCCTTGMDTHTLDQAMHQYTSPSLTSIPTPSHSIRPPTITPLPLPLLTHRSSSLQSHPSTQGFKLPSLPCAMPSQQQHTRTGSVHELEPSPVQCGRTVSVLHSELSYTPCSVTIAPESSLSRAHGRAQGTASCRCGTSVGESLFRPSPPSTTQPISGAGIGRSVFQYKPRSRLGRALSEPHISTVTRQLGLLELSVADGYCELPTIVEGNGNGVGVEMGTGIVDGVMDATATSPMICCDDITPADLKRDDDGECEEEDVQMMTSTLQLSSRFQPPSVVNVNTPPSHHHHHASGSQQHEHDSLLSLLPPTLPLPTLSPSFLPPQPTPPSIRSTQTPTVSNHRRHHTEPSLSAAPRCGGAKQQPKFVFGDVPTDGNSDGNGGGVLSRSFVNDDASGALLFGERASALERRGLLSVPPPVLSHDLSGNTVVPQPSTPPRRLHLTQPKTPRHHSLRSQFLANNLQLMDPTIPTSSPVLSAASNSISSSMLDLQLNDAQQQQQQQLHVTVPAFTLPVTVQDPSPTRRPFPRLLFDHNTPADGVSSTISQEQMSPMTSSPLVLPLSLPVSSAIVGVHTPRNADLNISGISSVAMSPSST